MLKQTRQEFTFIKKKKTGKENEEPSKTERMSNSVILNTTLNSNMDVETIKSSTFNECDRTMSSYAVNNKLQTVPDFTKNLN